QVRVRHRRRRPAVRDGRDADPGLLALLARGRVRGRHQPAELRQAVRTRLPGDAGLGQDRARAAAARGGDRAHAAEICRGAPAPHRRVGAALAPRSRADRPYNAVAAPAPLLQEAMEWTTDASTSGSRTIRKTT